MNSFFFSRFVIISLLFLVACEPQIPQTSPPASLPPTPTPDSGIITPENIDRLVQIKQLGMGEAIGSPLYSQDGEWIFQATTTGAYIFETTSQANARQLVSYATIPSDNKIMDVSPDGKILAIGDDLIEIDSGQKLFNMESHPEFKESTYAQTVRFSPDGLLIARGYDHKQTGATSYVGIWRLRDGKLLQTFDVRSLGHSLEFSADGNLLSIQSGAIDGSFFDLYDIQSGERLAEWSGNRSVFLSENRLAVESESVVRIFDLETKIAHHVFYGDFAAFSADEQRIVLRNFGQFKIYRVSDEQLLGILDGNFTNSDDIILRFSPDGETLAGYTADHCCGGHEDHLYLWRAEDGVLIKKLDEPNASNLFNFSYDGKSLAITDRIGSTQVFDTSDGSLKYTLGRYNYWMTGVAFLPNSQKLAFSTAEDNGEHSASFPGDYQSPLFFYNIDDGYLYNYQPTMKHNAPLAFSTDGQIYSPDDLRNLPLINDIQGNATSIAFSPDRKRVAVGYYNVLYVWDLSNQTLLFQDSVCPDGSVSSLAFSPDGQRLARTCTIMHDGLSNIQIWQVVPQGKLLKEIGTGFGVFMVTFSPDGRFVAAGGDQVGLWDAIDGNLLFSIQEKVINWGNFFGRLGLQSLAFSPDGQILAINSMPGSVELWAVDNHSKIFSLDAEIYLIGGPVTDIDFSPDGKMLAIGLTNGGIQIYGIK